MKVTEQKEKNFPLGVKLALIIGCIVLVSLGTVTFLNSYFVSKDVKITAEENNLTINTRSATTVQNEINSVRSNVLQLLDLINVASGGRTSALARQAEAFFFERNSDIAEVFVLTNNTSSNGRIVIHSHLKNTRFFTANEIDFTAGEDFVSQNRDNLLRACRGETICVNASPFFKTGVMALILPYRESGLEQCCLIFFSLESISEILGTGSTNLTFMINDTDDLLCHPESEKVLTAQSMKNYPLVKTMREKNQNNEETRQIEFNNIEENGKKIRYIGAYQKISVADI
ncbi:MAG: adenylate/guanylate cyclase domain-containing protein, partial [Alphaproteobacteria bacterium]|nr:adenylate/guanylate cyclase domain-containing protein [Alphaproteobacteria bacterium]